MAKAKHNPNDATFRNINSLKKRVEKLEQWVKSAERLLTISPEKVELRASKWEK